MSAIQHGTAVGVYACLRCPERFVATARSLPSNGNSEPEPTQTEERAALEEVVAAWQQDQAEWMARHPGASQLYPHTETLVDLEEARDALSEGARHV